LLSGTLNTIVMIPARVPRSHLPESRCCPAGPIESRP
jgi:hypothetical protein